MRKIFIFMSMALSFASCAYVTVKDKNAKEKEVTSSELTPAQVFAKNIAAMQYIEYATVVEDTVFVGLPSRRGVEHSQDNTAKTFLADMRKEADFQNIRYCKVINIAKEHIWSDTLVSGQIIGYADDLD